ncbi:MAG: lysylphosphatidylglycerol synthase domain-containing protein [Patescibacteria group bacterium]|nr:lysylphosphatidylglycerol synthase domain-containing protein [Patescibacteria group bacterium]
MKKIIIKYGKYIFSSIILLSLFYYIWHNKSDFVIILSLNIFQILLLSLLVILSIISSAYMYYLAIKSFGIKLKTKEWINLAFVNRLTNYFIQKSGLFTRAFYLKKKYKLSYKNILVLGFYLLGLQIAITIFLILLVLLVNNLWNLNLTIFLIIIFSLILSLYKSDLFTKFIFKKIKILSPYIYIWQNLNSKPKLLYKLIFIIFILFLINIIKIYLLYLFLYEAIKISEAIIINSFSMLSFLISFTPAGIGIRESLMALGGSIMGLDFKSVVIIAVADRAINMAWLLIIGIPATIWFSNYFLDKKNDQ